MNTKRERRGPEYFITLALLAIYCDEKYREYLHREWIGTYVTTSFTYSTEVLEACDQVLTERGIDLPPWGMSVVRVGVICTRFLKLSRRKIGRKNAIILTANKLAQLREKYGIEDYPERFEYSLGKTDSEVTYGA